MSFEAEKLKYKNSSTLSIVDCSIILLGCHRFEDLSDTDLDAIYRIATGQWAYHLTRQGYIDTLYKERVKRIVLV